jgi:hypothetical protein
MHIQPLSDIENGKRFFHRRDEFFGIIKEVSFSPVFQVAE